MSNIFLTAARITAGSSDNKIPEHKSSLHRRWRFFMSRKRVAIERKSMVMSQKIVIYLTLEIMIFMVELCRNSQIPHQNG